MVEIAILTPNIDPINTSGSRTASWNLTWSTWCLAWRWSFTSNMKTTMPLYCFKTWVVDWSTPCNNKQMNHSNKKRVWCMTDKWFDTKKYIVIQTHKQSNILQKILMKYRFLKRHYHGSVFIYFNYKGTYYHKPNTHSAHEHLKFRKNHTYSTNLVKHCNLKKLKKNFTQINISQLITTMTSMIQLTSTQNELQWSQNLICKQVWTGDPPQINTVSYKKIQEYKHQSIRII